MKQHFTNGAQRRVENGQLLPDAGPEGWTSRGKFAAALNEAALAEYCPGRILPWPNTAARAGSSRSRSWPGTALVNRRMTGTAPVRPG